MNGTTTANNRRDTTFPLLLPQLGGFWEAASVADIVAAWQPIAAQLANASAFAGNKPIVCTEVGYQSRNYGWIRGLNDVELDPRDCSVDALCVNLDAQAAAYEALITALYPHDWFEGVYLWLWRADPAAGGRSDADYTPQNKPASEEVLKRLWAPGGAVSSSK